MAKMVNLMEVCHYCGASYHPMPRYTLPGVVEPTPEHIKAWWVGGKGSEPVEAERPSYIYVCHLRFDEDEDGNLITSESECRHKAVADGYEYRPDLTPKR